MLVKKFPLLVAGLLLPLLVMAGETWYVGDKLIITLRSGQGNQYQILKTLPSGTPLEILEQTDTGYTRVRTPDGVEGWVRTQYLSQEPIAATRLEQAEKALARLQARNRKLQEELAKLRKRSAELETERKQLLASNRKAETELKRLNEVAARPLLLDRQNRELKQENVRLEKELQVLQQENQHLKDRSQREWFITGALVLFGGLLLGLIIPRIRWRKKSSW